MSKYRVHKFQCTSVDALKESIVDRVSKHFVDTKGFTKEEAMTEARSVVDSEVQFCLDSPQHLEGYHGDLRDEKAQVIIPRATVNKYLSGGASNDAGFNFIGDGCEAIISDYDKGSWWNASQDRWWQVAACKEACDLAWMNPDVVGVDIEEIDGNIEIYCTIRE